MRLLLDFRWPAGRHPQYWHTGGRHQTAEFAVAERLTERADSLYTENGQLRVVDEESADALLQLNVISIEDRPHTYTRAEQTEQYRFAVLVEAELVRVEDGRCCWRWTIWRDGGRMTRHRLRRMGGIQRWSRRWTWC